MKQIAVVGSGQLAKQFINDYPEQCRMFSLPEVDITDPKAFSSLEKYRPTIILNCAAYTNVVKAESDLDTATAVNATGVANLAQLAKQLDCLLVHFSTDYVFDGTKGSAYTETDATNPINAYGQTKLDGELAVAESGCLYLILRTAWLYGQDGPNFVLKMLELAQTKPELSAVTDKIGSPTWTKDLVGMTWALLEAKQTGLFHAVNQGEVSRYDFAKEILHLSKSSTPLRQASSNEFPSPAPLPDNTALDTAKISQFCPVRPWQEALAEYIHQL